MLPPKFDEHQFQRKAHAVGAETRIAFSDYDNGMRVKRHSPAVKRRNVEATIWANSDESLREVVLKFCEDALYIHKPAVTSEERLAAIAEKSQAVIPEKEAQLKKFLALYHQAAREKANEPYLKRLAVQVANIDKQIVILKRGFAALVTSVVVQSYRLGRDSRTVAEDLQLLPPMVRIWLYRCNRLAQGKIKSNPFRPTPKIKWPEKRLAHLYMLRTAGCTWKEVGRALGVSAASATLHWPQAQRAARRKRRP